MAKSAAIHNWSSLATLFIIFFHNFCTSLSCTKRNIQQETFKRNSSFIISHFLFHIRVSNKAINYPEPTSNGRDYHMGQIQRLVKCFLVNPPFFSEMYLIARELF